MKINFHKSESIPMNLDEERSHEIAHILNCPMGKFPLKYLGVPVHFERLKREDVQPLVDKLVKGIAGWRGRLLSYSSRLVLIKSCLASILVYILSFIKFPKWAITLLESQMTHCLWNNDNDCHSYHLASWPHVMMRQEFGVLGVLSLRELNFCLLASCVRRYVVDKEKIWKLIIDYDTKNPNIFYCRSNSCSNFWKRVLKAAQVAKMGYRWKVGDGKKIKFCEDVWIGSSSLAIQFWEIYCIVNEQNSTLADLWVGEQLSSNILFVDVWIEDFLINGRR
jgi:hypothetical protein